jgi:hypothetical protein
MSGASCHGILTLHPDYALKYKQFIRSYFVVKNSTLSGLGVFPRDQRAADLLNKQCTTCLNVFLFCVTGHILLRDLRTIPSSPRFFRDRSFQFKLNSYTPSSIRRVLVELAEEDEFYVVSCAEPDEVLDIFCYVNSSYRMVGHAESGVLHFTCPFVLEAYSDPLFDPKNEILWDYEIISSEVEASCVFDTVFFQKVYLG